jgi:hypothetical protein
MKLPDRLIILFASLINEYQDQKKNIADIESVLLNGWKVLIIY